MRAEGHIDAGTLINLHFSWTVFAVILFVILACALGVLLIKLLWPT